MPSASDTPLFTDADGYRYIIAELDAFKVFGPSFGELRRQIDPMMKAWLFSPDRLPELLEGGDRLRQIINDASTKRTRPIIRWALRQMGKIMRYIASHEEPDHGEAVDEDSSHDDGEPTLPHGQVKVLVGGRRRNVTENQWRLFDWLREHQSRLLPNVRAKLTEVYREVRDEESRRFADAPWFALQMPELARGDEIDATVRLSSVRLHPEANRMALVFDMLWEWYDYGDIAITITDGSVDQEVGPGYQFDW